MKMENNTLLGSMGPQPSAPAGPQQAAPPMAPEGQPAPQQGSIEPEQAMQKISEGISDMIHGPAREQILKTFEQDPSPKAAAAILYKPARQGIEQAEKAGVMVEEDFIFGVVTDGIDMLAEILEAMGQLKEGEDEEFRESTMMEVMMLHAEQVGDDPEAQEIAKQDLAGYAEDGSLEKTINQVERRGKRNGVDPNQMRQQGAQMVAPKQDPLAAGIQEGLR